ncbi:MAG: 3-dehydroquinate synthase [Firmicutes bacterium HGW-Firmicutes-11]|jgi:3-dehydroquinate synthase|nr:MAG: 3-dehydroquinate synthase [Firmicutes bacterium HGW-Firmicutes-11]
MKTLQVNSIHRSYPIHVGAGLVGRTGEFLRRMRNVGQVAVITDETVAALYRATLDESLQREGFSPTWLTIAPGEESKTVASFERLCETLASSGMRRDGLLIALGGGVTGDLAGFVAASYMRGMDIVQIPTTLLAQVDSSVGGKTGLNIPQGKNLIGAFWQPQMVIADPNFLTTLDDRQFACGMAEVVKYGAIASASLFERLDGMDRETAQQDMENIVYRCCGIKKSIVEEDERDTGRRMLLNFGHTFGHAIEQAGAYRTHTHGEAVAIGMVMAATLGESLGITMPGTAKRISDVLRSFYLPVECPYQIDILAPLLQIDKKAGIGGIRVVLLEEIGTSLLHTVETVEIMKLFDKGGAL